LRFSNRLKKKCNGERLSCISGWLKVSLAATGGLAVERDRAAIFREIRVNARQKRLSFRQSPIFVFEPPLAALPGTGFGGTSKDMAHALHRGAIISPV
jgi:hypothetical protein